MSLKIIAIFTLFLSIIHINCSIIPAAPTLKYVLVAPENIRPFSAQVSTFTKGLNVLDAPLAAGVLNPPAIFSRTVALPSPITAVLPAHEAYLPAPLSAPAQFSPHLAGFPGIGEPLIGDVPVPLGSLPSGSFVAHPEPFSHYGHVTPIAAAPPAHVLPFPNARSVHSIAPAPVVEPGVW